MTILATAKKITNAVEKAVEDSKHCKPKYNELAEALVQLTLAVNSPSPAQKVKIPAALNRWMTALIDALRCIGPIAAVAIIAMLRTVLAAGKTFIDYVYELSGKDWFPSLPR